ncbi:DUF1127 domain-containing protein [Aminobacter sp. Piv2-1]|uniref:DUF1127 domain-containing protein n=1 Tax=Aminobacter sp. Piv2-1 TaxID=3031122 RepID=UPI0030B24839
MTTDFDIVAEERPAGRRFPVLRLLMRCYDRQLQRLHLSDLDDKALEDIGLTRRDVERECARPFWR